MGEANCAKGTNRLNVACLWSAREATNAKRGTAQE
jgi:hypothetical protein